MGRVPKYHCVCDLKSTRFCDRRYSKGLLIDIVHGTPLDAAVGSLSAQQLNTLRAQLEEILRVLHADAKIFHKDIRSQNIILGEHKAPWLIDFSHSGLKYECEDDRSWDSKKQQDYRQLNVVFKQATSNMVHSDNPVKSQLC